MLLLAIVAALLHLSLQSAVIHVDEMNWRQILDNEWMVEFHAPWCPACKDLSKAWSSFALLSSGLNVKVAEVDVTAHPGLSGRFLVTALPTIFHVKDGVFRQYNGPRDKENFINFIEKKKWTLVEPLPSWKHPNSIQMGVVSSFFQLSMSIRDLHVMLMEKYGLAAWMSYTVFGVITLTLGCLFGFLIVLLIDRVFPTKLPSNTAQNLAKQKRRAKGGATKTSDKSGTDSNGSSEVDKATSTSDETTRRRVVKATRID